MRFPPERPPKGRVLIVAFLFMIAPLSAACAAPVPAPAPSSASSPSTAVPTAAAPPARAAGGFTVSGTNPVPVNGSQDTHAATPDATCNSGTFTADESVGTDLANGFSSAGFPVAAALLTHFLTGTGTGIDYRAGSPISGKALASSQFQAVNEQVQAEIARQLRAGRRRVQLSAAQLPRVVFGSKTSDLYWGFRGTQGLAVTGSGRRANGRYTGILTYVIRDSYGFPADDRLDGFGAPMRYLQTVCGAPPHAGGARWFPDAITVTVPFGRPA